LAGISDESTRVRFKDSHWAGGSSGKIEMAEFFCSQEIKLTLEQRRQFIVGRSEKR
jgi:hypothetical protein